MLCNTPSRFPRTSLFHSLRTLYPLPSSQLVLSSSIVSLWCPPSTSMINFCSKLTKSTTYCPIGCCRRNFASANCLFASLDHSFLSAGVCFRRKVRAVAVSFLSIAMLDTAGPRRSPSPHSSPFEGRGGKRVPAITSMPDLALIKVVFYELGHLFGYRRLVAQKAMVGAGHFE